MVGAYVERGATTASLNTQQKKGCVTISGKESDTISQEILSSIWKQAGWEK